MLLGEARLPFEQIPQMWGLIQDKAARRITMNLLQRNPLKRWPTQTVLANGFFASPASNARDFIQHEHVSALGSIDNSISHVTSNLNKVVIHLPNLPHVYP